MKTALLCLSLAGLGAAFQTPFLGSNARVQSQPTTIVAAGSGYASTRAGKEERVGEYKGWLSDAEMIFAIPAHSMSVKQVSQLRKMVPEDTKVRIAKNTLLRRAIEGDEKWAVVSDSLEASNMWFFVGSDLKGTFEGYEKFLKENRDLKDSHGYRFGAIDGELLDPAGVEKISKLPSKIDLYTKLAFALKQPSTKLAKTLKAAPTKLARAIKLSFEEGNEAGGSDEGAAPAEEPAAE